MKTYKFEIREESPICVSVVYTDAPSETSAMAIYGKLSFDQPLEAIVGLTGLRDINSGILLHLNEELKAQRRMPRTQESVGHYDTAIGLVSDVLVGRYDRMFS